jgi:hypothetical protein
VGGIGMRPWPNTGDPVSKITKAKKKKIRLEV